jgi:hypothetical protein
MKMIGRIWHGWTTHKNANTYETLLKMEIFPTIASKQIQGYQGVHLLRRLSGTEVEFVVMMWFESLDAVIKFAGEDYDRAYIPPKARDILSRYDDRSQHYEIRAVLEY